jgi:hypothetical protein
MMEYTAAIGDFIESVWEPIAAIARRSAIQACGFLSKDCTDVA